MNDTRTTVLVEAVDSLVTLACSMRHGALPPTAQRPSALTVSLVHAKLFLFYRSELAASYMACFTEADGDHRLRRIRAFVEQARLTLGGNQEVFGDTPWLFRWVDEGSTQAKA